MMSLLKQVFAQVPKDIDLKPKPGTDFAGLGNLEVSQIVGLVVNIFLVVAGIVFFFILVMGGIRWIMSQGDETKVKEARDQVTNALIGLVIVFAAWALTTLIGQAFGLTNLLQFKIVPITP